MADRRRYPFLLHHRSSWQRLTSVQVGHLHGKELQLPDYSPEPRTYELMTVLSPEVPEDEIPSAIERVGGYITSAQGELQETLTDSPWGRRRLAYPIRHGGRDLRDGFYTVYHFEIEPSAVSEIEREIKLNTAVIRYLMTRYEPVPPEELSEEDAEIAAEDEAAAAYAAAQAAGEAPTASAEEATTASDGATDAEASGSTPVEPDGADAEVAEPSEAAASETTEPEPENAEPEPENAEPEPATSESTTEQASGDEDEAAGAAASDADSEAGAATESETEEG